MTDIFEGLTNGMIYGLVAFSLVLIWRSTGILNFAQGAMAMFSTYLGMIVFAHDLSYWPLVAIAVVMGFALGGTTERVLVRHLYGKPEINPIVVMVGFLIVLEAVAAAIWSTTPRGIPNPFSPIDWQLGGKPVALSAFSVYEIGTALVVMTAIAVLFRFTKLGLQLRASALAPEVSRLLGVRVSRMLTLGWILSTGVGPSPRFSWPPTSLRASRLRSWTASSPLASSPPPSEGSTAQWEPSWRASLWVSRCSSSATTSTPTRSS